MAEPHLSRAELASWRDHGHGDRDRIVGHLAGCADCRHVAAELERERPLDAGEQPARFRPLDFTAAGRRAWVRTAPAAVLPRRLAYLATAAILVVAVVVVPGWLRDQRDSALRGVAAVVTPISPVDTTVGIDTIAFEWTTTPAAGPLRLVVIALDDAGAPAIDREVTGARYGPTAEERGRFRAGREYHWFVEFRGAGTGAGVSASARFRAE
jgi:hypothetical protein